MESNQEEINRLQSIVDKGKTFAIANQALTPPQNTPQDDVAQIAIINALEFSDTKAQNLFFQITGTALVNKKIVQVDAEPIMNLLGGKRFLFDLKNFSEANFANFKEDDVGPFMAHFFDECWPYYWANRQRYGIEQMDMGHLKTAIQTRILAAFSRGKNAKALNVAGRTFSEDWGSKLLSHDKPQKREGVLESLNPFKKM